MNYLQALLIFLFILLFPVSGYADDLEITGRVVAVSDGDTIKILTYDKRLVKVRLADIDAPEKNQPYGADAKKSLSDMVYNKAVKIVQTDIDRYGRSVARVYVGDIDVNAALVTDGSVWVYRKYSHDASLLKLETAAKEQKKGLWALQEDQRMQPWEWRKMKKSERNRNEKNR